MYVKETKKRTVIKTISWRVIAILNSWTVLSIVVNGSNLIKALIMNLSGFIIFYLFERVWSKIKYGRFIIEEKNKSII
jgi:uncharacterized membrane protein